MNVSSKKLVGSGFSVEANFPWPSPLTHGRQCTAVYKALFPVEYTAIEEGRPDSLLAVRFLILFPVLVQQFYLSQLFALPGPSRVPSLGE